MATLGRQAQCPVSKAKVVQGLRDQVSSLDRDNSFVLTSKHKLNMTRRRDSAKNKFDELLKHLRRFASRVGTISIVNVLFFRTNILVLPIMDRITNKHKLKNELEQEKHDLYIELRNEQLNRDLTKMEAEVELINAVRNHEVKLLQEWENEYGIDA